MNNTSHRDKAAEVLADLIKDSNIREQGVNPHGVAHAILIIEGHDYAIEVVAIPDGE